MGSTPSPAAGSRLTVVDDARSANASTPIWPRLTTRTVLWRIRARVPDLTMAWMHSPTDKSLARAGNE
jgi:hypothetical protein